MTTALPDLYRPTSDAEFLRLFNRLCVALREPPDDTGVQQSTYFEVLHDLPVQALEDGATALMKEAGRRFFPTSAEWREKAELAQMETLRRALPSVRAEPWHHDCSGCADTGWRQHECDGSAQCGRTKTHAPHSYVTACPCRPTNRTLARHQKFGSGA